MFLQISQYDAATRQLDAAIRMWLNEEDPVATHTVACASSELLDKLLRQAGKPSMLDDMKRYIVEDRRDEVINKLREAQNFFKHGSSDDKVVRFNPDSTDYVIMFSCIAAEQLGEDQSKEMRVFMFGLAVNNPQLFQDNEYKSGSVALRKSFPAGKTAVSKAELLELLVKLREYKAVPRKG